MAQLHIKWSSLENLALLPPFYLIQSINNLKGMERIQILGLVPTQDIIEDSHINPDVIECKCLKFDIQMIPK